MGYMLILILVLLYAVWRGWRTGLVHQLSGVLGIAFGIVCARIFCDPVSQWIVAHSPKLAEGFAAEYRLHILASALIFAGVYLAFKLIAGVLKSAMSVLHVGVFNSMAGAAFSLLKWVMIMSVVYNLILALSPQGTLANYCDDGDGNLVEVVMSAAPALMDTCGPDDLEHMRRMEEAKSISKNKPKPQGLTAICLV
ncbi:MAG: CvpA family protein [Bacteroidales bacterium]|nr:CvpA family protein [Bacteroidales bacterium]